MVPLADLWLPILVAAVAVFLVSSVIHMALPVHKSDFKRFEGREAAILAGLREQSVQPGSYMFPGATSMKEMSSPEMIERMKLGPVGYMTILPNGPMKLGGALVSWFVYSLVIGLFAAYVGSMTLAPGEEFLRVFRVTGTVAVMAYALSTVHESIWKGLRWSVTAKFAGDGIAYGLVTGVCFGWMWPGVGA
jgi:hypothetical protein